MNSILYLLQVEKLPPLESPGFAARSGALAPDTLGRTHACHPIHSKHLIGGYFLVAKLSCSWFQSGVGSSSRLRTKKSISFRSPYRPPAP